MALLDLLLRDTTGAELAARAEPNGVRVVITTGSIDKVEILAKLPYPILRKPFRLDALFEMLADTLARAAPNTD